MPEIQIGGSLSSSECRQARAGTVFSFMKNVTHTLQHDYGDAVAVRKLPRADLKTTWETGLQANGFRLCEGAGQTDIRRGQLLRFVAKDKATVTPITFELGIGWDTVQENGPGSVEVSDRQFVQYRFNPSAPTPWLDPNTVQFFGGYTQWQIKRETGGYTTSGGSILGSFSYSVRNTLAGIGEVMYSGAINGLGFPTGVPATESWVDPDIQFEMYNISGTFPTIYFPVFRTVIVGYSFRIF